MKKYCEHPPSGAPIPLAVLLVLALVCWASAALAQDPSTDPLPAPPRAEGEGPFERLVIRNATVIDGTGAPAGGPMDIVIEDNRITAVTAIRIHRGRHAPGC